MSAWATVKAPKAANLGEIMDDQAFLTSDLSVAELISFEEMQTGTAAPLPVVCEEVHICISISLMLARVAFTPVDTAQDFALADDDADLAFALALQEQLYAE